MKLTPFRALLLAVLAGVVWTFRLEISETAGDLKGAGTRLATWMEMNELAEGMRSHLRSDEAPRNFSGWIDERFSRKINKGVERRPSIDRYGTPYVLEIDRQRRVFIRSCGPDTTCRNDDDIEVEVNVDG